MMGMPLPSQSFASASMTSDNIPKSAEEARILGLQLSKDRKVIDDEIQLHIQALQEQGATMVSPLIDTQGFPLATVDIVTVRTARSRIIALRNDREALEKRMRDVLEVALAKKDSDQPPSSTTSLTTSSAESRDPLEAGSGRAWARMDGRSDGLSMLVDTQDGDASDWREVGGLEVFAKVNTVAESSPAQMANLCIGDEILMFGELDAATAHRSTAQKDLRNLPSVVQEGKEIPLTVLRKDESGQKTIKRLRLTPSSGWGGRGMLGCHLVPV